MEMPAKFFPSRTSIAQSETPYRSSFQSVTNATVRLNILIENWFFFPQYCEMRARNES